MIGWTDPASARRYLIDLLVVDDPTPTIFAAVDDGFFQHWIPEIPAMSMEQDPIHRHKDVLAHSVAVTAKTPPRLRIRLAALFHDVGKPATRRIGPDGVTFRHHEAVGARITTERLDALGFEAPVVADVSRLVALSGRFKGYQRGWTDSAVRRYARDGGALLGDLNVLVRCDCTTRNPRRVAALHHQIDALERRIRDLAALDRAAQSRPALSGDDVMKLLDIGPGPLVGDALQVIEREAIRSGPLDERRAIDVLRRWWERRPA